jgi:hypothetical protein
MSTFLASRVNKCRQHLTMHCGRRAKTRATERRHWTVSLVYLIRITPSSLA